MVERLQRLREGASQRLRSVAGTISGAVRNDEPTSERMGDGPTTGEDIRDYRSDEVTDQEQARIERAREQARQEAQREARQEYIEELQEEIREEEREEARQRLEGDDSGSDSDSPTVRGDLQTLGGIVQERLVSLAESTEEDPNIEELFGSESGGGSDGVPFVADNELVDDEPGGTSNQTRTRSRQRQDPDSIMDDDEFLATGRTVDDDSLVIDDDELI